GQINFPFNFCFYGQTMTSCFINNNGNISFGASYGTFTANSFPDPNFVMIAPFWGDVDTRNLSSGLVYYKITPTYMVVHWKLVDYYDSDLSENSTHQSLYNDFQLILTNGTDPILPSGNNVSFCYGDMQWTTGDASNGTNGFGGAPATVGVNRGNGVDYIQIGRFDQPGTTYDGPFGNPDGISWLDNQTFYFDVCNNGSGNNLPPIVNSAAICDTLYMCVGDSINISATFLSPEQSQVTTANMNWTCLGFTINNNVAGNPAVIDATLIANSANVGLNTITITGTDNGLPPAVTSVNVYVEIVNNPYVNFSANPSAPVVTGTTVQFTDLSHGAVSWNWDFGDGNTSTQQNPQHTYNTAVDTVYVVTLTIQLAGGCTGTDTIHYQVLHEPLGLIAPNVVTPNGDGVNDLFQFQNLEDYPKAKLEVYNRWGNLVYSNNDYHNEWKPTVTDGVYYYVLSWRADKKPLTGFFEVIR
ncbi:MAG TPA: gliding motility-associated C-terminal domain-containing protein, partial [Bacteroidia bacterium]|nr:gliding motility-associated C-terminal domain-containing protein [Bacteroidia bacterium]